MPAMTVDEHLRAVLARHHVDMGPTSPVLQMRAAFLPLLQEWAGSKLLSVHPSGSFAKGTAVRTGTDIDLFISLAHDTSETLQEIHELLIRKLKDAGYSPKRQTMSIGIRAGNNTYDVDLVPAKKRNDSTGDHSVYHRKSGTARKTNIARHIAEVRPSGRLDEIKLLKVWRNRLGLDFPSFYLELSTIAALANQPFGTLEHNMLMIFAYLRDTFPTARVIDPAVPSNAVSDDLTMAERLAVKKAAINALNEPWTNDFV